MQPHMIAVAVIRGAIPAAAATGKQRGPMMVMEATPAPIAPTMKPMIQMIQGMSAARPLVRYSRLLPSASTVPFSTAKPKNRPHAMMKKNILSGQKPTILSAVRPMVRVPIMKAKAAATIPVLSLQTLPMTIAATIAMMQRISW